MAFIRYNTPFIPHLPGWAEQQLSDACDEMGISGVTVTSTYRTVESQAQAMYDNLVAGRKVSYAAPGRSVLEAGTAAIAAGYAPSAVVQAMVDKINEVGPANVSHHIDPSLTVADIAPSSMTSDQQRTFAAYFKAKHSTGGVGEFLYPEYLGAPAGMRDPAFHIQFLEDQSAPRRAIQAAENVATSTAAGVEEVTGIPAWLQGTVAGLFLLWVLGYVSRPEE